MEHYKVIGIMTGSSLDGLDFAFCDITVDSGNYHYKVLKAECVPMPDKWKLRLEKLVMQNAVTYIKTHTFFGHFMGEEVRKFIDANNIAGDLDFIASHGQTIFHQPENHFTSQIGDGAAIAVRSGFPVVCDFRTTDVALGGQGTPIAPIANKLFFPDYNFFLNLGGIANIAANTGDKFVAFDIVPVNLVLNKLASQIGKDYDKDGELARSGSVNKGLLAELNASWYYAKEYPKSLSGGWVSKVMLPVVQRHQASVADKLRTVVEVIALQTAESLKQITLTEGITVPNDAKMLVTGGGAFNTFLIEQLQEKLPLQIVVPDRQTVEFKEAILMALVGVLRVRNEANCLSSVTGASRNNIGGAIYQGHEKQLKTVIS
jgi:anhydro-N-acetylmuramic acid kinase